MENVKISIYALVESEEQPMIFYTTGTLAKDNKGIFIDYIENESLNNTISKIGISTNVVTLNRIDKFEGFVSTMVFEKGHIYNTAITAQGGSLSMSIITHDISVVEDENSLTLKLVYTLEIQGATSKNTFKLIATKK